MNFCSDNVTAAAPEIIQALLAENHGAAMPYGDDPISQQLTAEFSRLFEKEVVVFPMGTGSAANALALSVLSPSYGAVYCHPNAHINVDECGAPEFYTGGAKLVLVDGSNGKLVADRIPVTGAGVVHRVQPAAISITQATEAGTVYQIPEIQAIAQVAKTHNLSLHMDGARFANALVSLGCSPAAMTWQAGVDVLSFGATKNGAWAAEAVIFFRPELVKDFAYRRKQGGHLFSKQRFLAIQLAAYLKEDLWLKNARHANRAAQHLNTGLTGLEGVKILYPVEANILFVEMTPEIIQTLKDAGFSFYTFGNVTRLVMAFNTDLDDVNKFITVVRSVAQNSTKPAPEPDLTCDGLASIN